MIIKGKVLSAKKETRSLVSKATGMKKEHTIYHVLLLSTCGGQAEVLNCEGWNTENFVLPEVNKDWESPKIRSVTFEGDVGTVRF